MTADASPIRSVTALAREVPLGELRAHPGNPRKISPARLEQLQRTLVAEREMLQARPLIALPDGTVIAGNQRLVAARALSWESIPVVYADLDEETARRWMRLDNRPAGEDDVEMLAALLRELDAGQQDLAGYAAEDVDAILRAALPVSPRDPDEAPPVPVEAKSRLGEVYELGPHRVMCGDSSDREQVVALVAGEEATMVLADPPYNVAYTGGSTNDAARPDAYWDTWDTWEHYAAWLTVVLTNGSAASDARAALHLWFGSSQMRAITRALDASGWEDRTLIIWNKLSAHYGALGAQYKQRYEPLFYCHKRRQSPRWFGPTNEPSVWDVDQPRVNDLHPTMKPVELYERSIRNHTQRTDRVLELFGGSGTALIAAEITGRAALLIERDPRFVDVIRQRYADYTGQPEYAP